MMTYFDSWWSGLPDHHPLKARNNEFPSTYKAVKEAWNAAMDIAITAVKESFTDLTDTLENRRAS